MLLSLRRNHWPVPAVIIDLLVLERLPLYCCLCCRDGMVWAVVVVVVVVVGKYGKFKLLRSENEE